MSSAEPTAVLGLGVRVDLVAAAADAAETPTETLWPLEIDQQLLHQRHHSTRWRAVVVVAADLGLLRLALPTLASLGTTRRLCVTLLDHALDGGASPRWPGSVALAEVTTLRAEPCEGGGRHVDLSFSRPVRVHKAAGALVADRPERSPARPGSGLRVAAADLWGLRWCIGEASAHTAANADLDWRGDDTRGLPCDVVVGASSGAPDTAADGGPAEPAAVAERTVDVSDRCPPLDLAVVNPRGFRTDSTGSIGHLVVTVTPAGPDVRVNADGLDLATWGRGGWLAPTTVAALRPLAYVDATAVHHADPVLAATVLSQLAGAAVPLLTGRLPTRTRPLLHPDLVTSLESATASELTGELSRETRVVRTRRAALRGHAHASEWARIRNELGLSAAPRATVSVLAVTRRPHLLQHALSSIATQEGVDVELVLVTHGFELSRGQLDQFRDQLKGEVVVRTADPSMVLGDVLNLGTDAASGEVLAKMDDDDWYGPHHLEDLTQTLSWSGATLVGAMHQFTYLGDVDVTVRRDAGPLRDREVMHVPGPTIMIRRDDLLALGGWRPTPIAEDLALSHAVRESGGSVHEMHGLGFVLCRHGRGHTWTAGNDRFLTAAAEQWPGFHPPPELGDLAEAMQHYEDLRRLDANGSSLPS